MFCSARTRAAIHVIGCELVTTGNRFRVPIVFRLLHAPHRLPTINMSSRNPLPEYRDEHQRHFLYHLDIYMKSSDLSSAGGQAAGRALDHGETPNWDAQSAQRRSGLVLPLRKWDIEALRQPTKCSDERNAGSAKKSNQWRGRVCWSSSCPK